MKSRMLFASVLAWAAHASAAQAAAEASKVREQDVWQTEFRWHQAYLDGNVDALGSLEAEGFAITDETGVVTHKPSDLGAVKSGEKFLRLAIHDPFVRVDGDTAFITAKLALETERAGIKDAGIYAVTDTLIARNGRWQVLASERTKIAPTADSATEPAPREAGWLKRHQEFAAVAKRGGVDLLFLGDSITDFWRTTGAAVFQKYWKGVSTANFGLSGDRTGQVLWRIRHGELEGLEPKGVMLMIGTNDLGYERDDLTERGSTEEAAEGVKAVVAAVRQALPHSRILLLAVFPRSPSPTDPLRVAVAAVNRRIAALADGDRVRYLDIGNGFLAADGTLPRAIMPDALHPSAAGYEIWGRMVQAPLAALLKAPPLP